MSTTSPTKERCALTQNAVIDREHHFAGVHEHRHRKQSGQQVVVLHSAGWRRTTVHLLLRSGSARPNKQTQLQGDCGGRE